IYVKDVTRALRLAMDSDYCGPMNVGTGISYSFNDVVEMLADKMGLEVDAEHVNNPIKNYVAHTLADTAKAEEVLGFRAEHSLEMGIDELLKSYCR
ncbi:MAG: nucleoside-diphosphate sugar epimerase, partial [Methanothrix harundinacea]|nr:nucleoside-diphosphate sugar epimerase [Methanothrix harundinacea]